MLTNSFATDLDKMKLFLFIITVFIHCGLFAQSLKGTYVAEKIPEMEIELTFLENRQFSMNKVSSHNNYFGRGHYFIVDGSLYLVFDSKCNYGLGSKFDLISTTQSKNTRLIFTVIDQEQEPISPIITVNKESYNIEPIGHNTRIVTNDYTTPRDTVTIISPGYHHLKIPLNDFKNQDAVISVSLQFADNKYPIEGMQVYPFKSNKEGFILELEDKMIQFVFSKN